MPGGGARIGAGRKPREPHLAEVPRASGLPKPPPWLSKAARANYVYYGEQLGDRMTPGDRDALAQYASVLASIAAIEKDMRAPDFTRVVPSPDGGVKLHPLVAEHRQQLGLAKTWATALGLTPTSRARAKAAHPQEQKDWRAVVYQTPTR